MPLGPVRRILRDNEIDPIEFASIIQIQPSVLNKYVNGERGLTAERHYLIIERYGAIGCELSSALSDARDKYVATHPIDKKKRQRYAVKSEPVTKPMPSEPTRRRGDAPNPVDKNWDGKLYTFAEWRSRWGYLLETDGTDATGRIWGYFASEPDFLGE